MDSRTPIHLNVAISLETVSYAFSRSTNPITILSRPSSLFSTSCLRVNITYAVPLPSPMPYCSFPFHTPLSSLLFLLRCLTALLPFHTPLPSLLFLLQCLTALSHFTLHYPPYSPFSDALLLFPISHSTILLTLPSPMPYCSFPFHTPLSSLLFLLRCLTALLPFHTPLSSLLFLLRCLTALSHFTLHYPPYSPFSDALLLFPISHSNTLLTLPSVILSNTVALLRIAII